MRNSYHRALVFVVLRVLADDPGKCLGEFRAMFEAGSIAWPEFVHLAGRLVEPMGDEIWQRETKEGSLQNASSRFDAFAEKHGDYRIGVSAEWDQAMAELETAHEKFIRDILVAGGCEDLATLRADHIQEWDELSSKGEFLLLSDVRRSQMVPLSECWLKPGTLAAWRVSISYLPPAA